MSNVLSALCRETSTKAKDWEEIDGPRSRVGVDHWFRNKKTAAGAYVNNDQGHITVDCDAGEESGP